MESKSMYGFLRYLVILRFLKKSWNSLKTKPYDQLDYVDCWVRKWYWDFATFIFMLFLYNQAIIGYYFSCNLLQENFVFCVLCVFKQLMFSLYFKINTPMCVADIIWSLKHTILFNFKALFEVFCFARNLLFASCHPECI